MYLVDVVAHPACNAFQSMLKSMRWLNHSTADPAVGRNFNTSEELLGKTNRSAE